MLPLAVVLQRPAILLACFLLQRLLPLLLLLML
jgi:hypothetical protein